jgi:hypothetical protein
MATRRMRLTAVEDVADRLAFIGRERRDIDQRCDLGVTSASDDSTGIRVTRQHDRPSSRARTRSSAAMSSPSDVSGNGAGGRDQVIE